MIPISTSPLVCPEVEVKALDCPSLFSSDEIFECIQKEDDVSFQLASMTMETCIKSLPMISGHEDSSSFDDQEVSKEPDFPLMSQNENVHNIAVVGNQLEDVNDEGM